MNIGFFGLQSWEKDYLEKILLSANLGRVDFSAEKLNKDHLPEKDNFEVISVFANSVIKKEVLDALPNLKFIATRSTGFDHIDITECEKRGVAVSNIPTYGENTVAEHTFGLLLALSRKIYASYNRIREEGSFSLEGLQGFDLNGKTLGVVGVGNIGVNVIRIAKGFEMNVIANDTNPDESLVKKLGFEYKNLDDTLSLSDVITLHVPHVKETHHLINKENIGKMKKGSYLINTSRGEILQTEALVDALKNGHLAGAGLDVLEEEGVIKDELEFITKGHPQENTLKTTLSNHVLIDMPNVIVTPHNAFNTKEALQRILDTTIKNISDFSKGNPQNLVTGKKANG